MRFVGIVLLLVLLNGCNIAGVSCDRSVTYCGAPPGSAATASPLATPTPDHVIAQELLPLIATPNASLTYGDASKKYCTRALNWADAQASPALYKSRCAWVQGTVEIPTLDARLFVVEANSLLGSPSVIIDMARYNPATLWAGHTTSPYVAVLGTIQGVTQGRLDVYVEAIWDFPMG